jgi:hypothetical protein
VIYKNIIKALSLLGSLNINFTEVPERLKSPTVPTQVQAVTEEVALPQPIARYGVA